MHINGHSTAIRTERKQTTNQQHAQQDQQSNKASLSSRPKFSNNLLQLLLQLIIRLLQQLTQQPPEPEAKSLNLSRPQQDNLKQLAGFDPETLTADDVAKIHYAKGGIPQSFTQNQQKWQSVAGGPDEFIGYSTQQSCFCPSEFNRPMNITEPGGEITGARHADTNEPEPDNKN